MSDVSTANKPATDITVSPVTPENARSMIFRDAHYALESVRAPPQPQTSTTRRGALGTEDSKDESGSTSQFYQDDNSAQQEADITFEFPLGCVTAMHLRRTAQTQEGTLGKIVSMDESGRKSYFYTYDNSAQPKFDIKFEYTRSRDPSASPAFATHVTMGSSIFHESFKKDTAQPLEKVIGMLTLELATRERDHRVFWAADGSYIRPLSENQVRDDICHWARLSGQYFARSMASPKDALTQAGQQVSSKVPSTAPTYADLCSLNHEFEDECRGMRKNGRDMHVGSQAHTYARSVLPPGIDFGHTAKISTTTGKPLGPLRLAESSPICPSVGGKVESIRVPLPEYDGDHALEYLNKQYKQDGASNPEGLLYGVRLDEVLRFKPVTQKAEPKSTGGNKQLSSDIDRKLVADPAEPEWTIISTQSNLEPGTNPYIDWGNLTLTIVNDGNTELRENPSSLGGSGDGGRASEAGSVGV